jgi:hypothetical protein
MITTVYDISATPSTLYLGSQDLYVCSNGDMIAKSDLFGASAPGGATDANSMRIMRSADGGLSWTLDQTYAGGFWGAFLPDLGDGIIRMIGTSKRYGSPILLSSSNNGNSWASSTLIDGTGLYYHTAPTPSVIKDGRIYKAFERNNSASYPLERVFVLHADITDDLSDPASWTASAELECVTADLPFGSWGWSEGNMIETPNGDLEVWLRVDLGSGETVMVAKIPFDGTNLGTPRFEAFDGGCVKFYIIKDDVSGDYYMARNTIKINDGNDRRTSLVLDKSTDLVSWRRLLTIAEVEEADYASSGHHYPSIRIDGSDLIGACRTAQKGIAKSAHDNNASTFFRVADFRKL